MADFLGIVSAEEEVSYPTGNAGTISTGIGDAGGVSYGIPQFSSTQGSARSFAIWLNAKVGSPTTARLSTATPGTATFNALWKDVHSELGEEKFAMYQNLRVMEQYYNPFATKVKNDNGIDVNKDRALQEMAFSTSVQFGPNTSVVKDSGARGTDSVTTIINKIYDYKISSVYSYFSGSSSAVQESVKRRFAREKTRVLGFVGKPPQPTSVEDIGKVVDSTLTPGSDVPANRKGVGGFKVNTGFLNDKYVKEYVMSELGNITPLQLVNKEMLVFGDISTTGLNVTDKFSNLALQGNYNINDQIIGYTSKIQFRDGPEVLFSLSKRVTISSLSVTCTRSIYDTSSLTRVAPNINELAGSGVAVPTFAKGQTLSFSLLNTDFINSLKEGKSVVLTLGSDGFAGAFENFKLTATVRLDFTKYGLEGQ